jgi:predicted nucleic acid-binding protein
VTFALDSSVMVAAVCLWHEHHEPAAAAIEQRLAGRHRLVSPAHAITEAYAVLTRLPAPHRLAPADAWSLVSSNFIEGHSVVGLAATGHVAMLRHLAASGIGGGRTYDALIVAAASHADVSELLTFNPKHFEQTDGPRIVEVGKG